MKRTWLISQGMARQFVRQVVQEGAFGKQALCSLLGTKRRQRSTETKWCPSAATASLKVKTR